jgi:hypothetical protein
MKRLDQNHLAKLEGGLSPAAVCGFAMVAGWMSGGWGLPIAVGVCLLMPSDLK